MIKRELSLNIEELVLHGFAPNQRYAIADALEEELSRLLTRHFAEGNDFAPFNLKDARVDAGNFQVESAAKPDAIGNKVAQAIYGVLIK